MRVCARRECKTRLVDCWTTCFCVRRVREEYVGQWVVDTAVVGGIGDWGCGSDREGKWAFV